MSRPEGNATCQSPMPAPYSEWARAAAAALLCATLLPAGLLLRPAAPARGGGAPGVRAPPAGRLRRGLGSGVGRGALLRPGLGAGRLRLPPVGQAGQLPDAGGGAVPRGHLGGRQLPQVLLIALHSTVPCVRSVIFSAGGTSSSGCPLPPTPAEPPWTLPGSGAAAWPPPGSYSRPKSPHTR